MKFILVVFLLVAFAIGLFQVDDYSADLRRERFFARTRQIAQAMPEDLVIKTMGREPSERIDVRLHKKEDYDVCRKAGAFTVLSYRLHHVGWFNGFGITTGWDEFLVCLNQEGRVIQTDHNRIYVRGPQSGESGTLAWVSRPLAIVGNGSAPEGARTVLRLRASARGVQNPAV